MNSPLIFFAIDPSQMIYSFKWGLRRHPDDTLVSLESLVRFMGKTSLVRCSPTAHHYPILTGEGRTHNFTLIDIAHSKATISLSQHSRLVLFRSTPDPRRILQAALI